MKGEQQPLNLEQILARIGQASQDRDEVTVGTMIQTVGRRSFAPLLLLAGLIAFSPVSGIPGVPTLVGLTVLLISGQLLIRRKHFWLPKWLLKRSVSRARLDKALKFLRQPARFVDHFLRPRLSFLTHGAGFYAMAILCVLIAVTMPPMELVPFAATSAGAALTALALSMIAEDGLLAVIAVGIILLTAALAVKGLAA